MRFSGKLETTLLLPLKLNLTVSMRLCAKIQLQMSTYLLKAE